MIQAHTVRANDDFSYELGLEPKLHHVPAKHDRGDPVYFYGVFHTKDGGYGFEVMSLEDVQAHAKRYSKAYDSGPWKTNFEEMAKKTVLKRALKYAPLKSDFVRAVAADESIKSTISDDMFSEPDLLIVDADTGETADE
jgi:recombination protein RecT